jgi:hypothetical protein
MVKLATVAVTSLSIHVGLDQLHQISTFRKDKQFQTLSPQQFRQVVTCVFMCTEKQICSLTLLATTNSQVRVLVEQAGLKAQPERLGQQVQLVRKAQSVQLVRKAQRDQLVRKAQSDQLDLKDQPDLPVRKVPQAQLAHKAPEHSPTCL